MKYAVVITGASRGFGRCLVLDFVRNLKPHTTDLYLWARTEADLKETERLAYAERKKQGDAGELRCFVEVVDLSIPTAYSIKVDQIVLQLESEKYDQVFLVHNAGSLGHLGLAQECASSPVELAQYWELNVTSVVWLNKRFLDSFGASRDKLTHISTKLVIVNITSLCGIEPFKTHMMYCTGKAAREMHHRVIAIEQTNHVEVLQYSPGPMDTTMQKIIRESPLVAPELRKQFEEMKANGTLIPPAQSSKLCVKLVINGKYQTGAHIDYYDLDSSS